MALPQKPGNLPAPVEDDSLWDSVLAQVSEKVYLPSHAPSSLVKSPDFYEIYLPDHFKCIFIDAMGTAFPSEVCSFSIYCELEKDKKKVLRNGLCETIANARNNGCYIFPETDGLYTEELEKMYRRQGVPYDKCFGADTRGFIERGDVGKVKKFSALIEELNSKGYKIKPEECLVIGDGLSDQEGARRSNIFYLEVPPYVNKETDTDLQQELKYNIKGI